MGSKTFKDIPINIQTAIYLLTGLLRFTTIKKGIWIKCLNIFPIGHNTAITSCYWIVRSDTGNSILHITSTRIACIIISYTICIPAIRKIRPVSIETCTNLYVLKHIIIIIETSIIPRIIIIYLNSFFIHHTNRYIEIRFIISACRRNCVILKNTSTHKCIKPIGIRVTQWINHP